MSILTGPEIRRQIELGNIAIDPFDERLINPNSINVRLSDELKRYDERILDVAKVPQTIDIKIGSAGMLLLPNVGYLGATMEVVHCRGFAPVLDGRSTVGRYFLKIHHTAGFGDNGFHGTFTLELMATYLPVMVYPFIEIGQLSFHTLEGEQKFYTGGYNGQKSPRGPKPLYPGRVTQHVKESATHVTAPQCEDD